MIFQEDYHASKNYIPHAHTLPAFIRLRRPLPRRYI